MKCGGNIKECLNCPYPDCINNHVKKTYELSSEKYEIHKNKTNKLQKTKRQNARENGFCTICFKEKATHGMFCYECYLRQKRYQKNKLEKKKLNGNYKNNRESWKSNGFCVTCGKERLEDKMVCSECYEKRLVAIHKCLEHQNTKNARKTKFLYGKKLVS